MKEPLSRDYQKYAPGVDPMCEEITFDNDHPLKAIEQITKNPDVIEVKKLKTLLGEKHAKELMLAIVNGTASWVAVAKVAIARIAELPTIAFPFDLIVIGPDNPSGRYPRTVVSEPEWYGRAYVGNLD